MTAISTVTASTIAPAEVPLVVGLGGTTRAGSSSERVLRACLDEVERLGARVELLGAADLQLPHYPADSPVRAPAARRLVELLRAADAVVIASPGYHGGVSGMVKNALDYAEDLRNDARPYLDGRVVGCIACAYGWQGAVTTLQALRAIVHALRGWPTPLGVAVNSAEPLCDDDGRIASARLREQLGLLARQLVGGHRVGAQAR